MLSMPRLRFALLLFSLGIAACAAPGGAIVPADSFPAEEAALPTSLPTAAVEPIVFASPTAIPAASTPAPPPDANPHIASLLEQVSAERLEQTVIDLAAIHSRHVNSATIGAAAGSIFASFEEAGGRLTVEYDDFPLVWNEVYSTQVNVIVTLPGSDPAAGMIVIGAHYDSRTVDIDDRDGAAPGANDNASGTAIVLELARVLAGETPRATIVFAAFSAEEVGKIGSVHFVQEAQARGDDIRAMIALDTIGNPVGDAGEGMIRVFSADPPESSSRQLARYVDVIGARYLPRFDVQVQGAVDRPYRYSDHVPFSDAGIPAARLIEALEELNRNHSSLDRPEHLSPFYMRDAARLALASIANLAWAADAPAGLGVQGDRVAWQPVSGAAEYLVAVRRADSLEIQRTFRAADPWVDGALLAGWDFVSIASISAGGSLSLFSPERLAP